jgi:hypothetical protein
VASTPAHWLPTATSAAATSASRQRTHDLHAGAGASQAPWRVCTARTFSLAFIVSVAARASASLIVARSADDSRNDASTVREVGGPALGDAVATTPANATLSFALRAAALLSLASDKNARQCEEEGERVRTEETSGTDSPRATVAARLDAAGYTHKPKAPRYNHNFV